MNYENNIKEKLESIITIHKSDWSKRKLGECGEIEMLGKIYDSNSDLNDPDRVKILKYAIDLLMEIFAEVGMPGGRKLINNEVWNVTPNREGKMLKVIRLSDHELIDQLYCFKFSDE